MSAWRPEDVRLVGFAVAAALALTLERLRPHAGSRPSLRTNGALWLVDVALLGLLCGACACTVARWAGGASFGLLNALRVPLVPAVLVTIAVLDAVSYAWHRANHRFAVLWRFHRVHHSDRSFTTTTALRFHPGELILSLPLRLVAIAVLGAPVVAVIVFEIAFTFSNLLEHGDVDLPDGLERRVQSILVTPALHRRHHALDRADRDRNFGTIFSFWDRLGRTYRESRSRDRISVGLAEATSPVGPMAALALPFSRIRPTGAKAQ